MGYAIANPPLPTYFMAAALASSSYQKKMIFDARGTTIKHIYISILAKMNLALPNATDSSDNMSLDVRLHSIVDEVYEQPNISINPDGNISDEQLQELEDFGSKSFESCLLR